MEKQIYNSFLSDSDSVIESIRQRAYKVHAYVNQHYGTKGEPYAVHLEAVAQFCMKYLYLVCEQTEDIIPVIFGSFFHDSIEDARLTYNDVCKIAREFMSEDKAIMAAEIAYALTNDKGRTRQERAGEKYYLGIRQTPYAPFVKFCDRLANTSYSVNDKSDLNRRMLSVYKSEYPHFIEAITIVDHGLKYSIPDEAISKMNELLSD